MQEIGVTREQATQLAIECNSNSSASSIRAIKHQSKGNWPPALADSAYHGTAGAFARRISEEIGLDSALLLASCLTWAAAHVGANAVIHIGDDRYQPRLFTVLTGEDAAQGARAIRYAREFFASAQSVAGPRRLPAAITRQIVLSDGDAFAELIESGGDHEPSLAVSDAESPRQGLLLEARDFGMTWRKVCHLNNSLGTHLKLAFEGAEPASPGTPEGQASRTGPVSIIAHASTGELQGSERGTGRWQALAGCILWVYDKAGSADAQPRAVSSAFKEEIVGKLARAIKFADNNMWMCLSPNAEAICAELYKELSLQARHSVIAISVYRTWIHVIQVASIFALLDESSIVEPEHLQAAKEFVRYCAHSAQLLFDDVAADEKETRILDALATGPKTQTQLHAACGRHLKGFELNRRLTNLVNRREITGERIVNKGRATMLWRRAPAFTSES